MRRPAGHVEPDDALGLDGQMRLDRAGLLGAARSRQQRCKRGQAHAASGVAEEGTAGETCIRIHCVSFVEKWWSRRVTAVASVFHAAKRNLKNNCHRRRSAKVRTSLRNRGADHMAAHRTPRDSKLGLFGDR